MVRVEIRNPNDFGPAIRKKREQMGMHQRECARLVGISQRHLCLIENASPARPIDPKLSTVFAAGRILDLEFVVITRLEKPGGGE